MLKSHSVFWNLLKLPPIKHFDLLKISFIFFVFLENKGRYDKFRQHGSITIFSPKSYMKQGKKNP